MLASIKHLFIRRRTHCDLSGIEAWARRRGHDFKRVRNEDGFAIDGMLEGKAWRMEWGLPQRHYIENRELRFRMELELPGEMQMLLLSRPLMDWLERKTFEEFTDNVQTQIGTKTPEEMRWLVMYPKVDLASLKTLRARFGAVASVPAEGLSWIEGPLANLLVQAAEDWLQPEQPLVLMALRGRVYLRMQLVLPEPASVAAALALFETAAAQAVRATGLVAHGAVNSTDIVRNTAWQTLVPEAPVKR